MDSRFPFLCDSNDVCLVQLQRETMVRHPDIDRNFSWTYQELDITLLNFCWATSTSLAAVSAATSSVYSINILLRQVYAQKAVVRHIP